MTRKKIRYSELTPAGTPVVPPTPPEAMAPATPPQASAEATLPPPSAPSPVAAARVPRARKKNVPPPVAEPAVDAAPTVVAPLVTFAPLPPRARRNSSPVELAHALAAARAAESAAEVLAAPDAAPDAAPRALEEPQRLTTDMLIFRVGEEHFAVDLLAVEEVIDLPVIHHVPEMPPAMLGVVAVRGSLTPVYSPQTALGVPLAQRAAVLIFRCGASRVGVLIDDVDDATALDLRELREASHPSEGGDTVVLGVVRHEERLIAIVDVDALIAACQQALQETA